MGNKTSFIAEYLNDGHLSIPEEIVATLALKKGKKVRVVIETGKFNKRSFLELYGIGRNKSEEEIAIYREILKEREKFGRGEINL
jgi:hypothetical protein